MLDTVVAIQAGDIFFYVDNYRRLIRKSIGEINREKELYEEKFWQSEFVGIRYYAGLRAFEHAINYVLKQEEPGMVLFGDEGKQGASVEGQSELIEAACRKVRDEKRAEVEGLKRQLQQASAKEQELQGELVQREQQIRILARRMESAQSTYVVLIGAMGLIITVLVGIQFLF
jgi:hypothetical protein